MSKKRVAMGPVNFQLTMKRAHSYARANKGQEVVTHMTKRRQKQLLKSRATITKMIYG